jgi:DNA helicase IV
VPSCDEEVAGEDAMDVFTSLTAREVVAVVVDVATGVNESFLTSVTTVWAVASILSTGGAVIAKRIKKTIVAPPNIQETIFLEPSFTMLGLIKPTKSPRRETKDKRKNNILICVI